jgi:WD40 repeat protein/serine/threonine protein kinase
MRSALTSDEDLVRRLPLPLAQLYRRAHNAKTPLERHLTAFYLWEAGLKLLASVAVVEYAERTEHDPKLAERLQNLARPSLGHWWEFVRLLLPALADAGDAELGKLRDQVLGRARGDLPRAAQLDVTVRAALDDAGGSRTSVRLSDLFDRLVRYRNRELGHGASGRRPDEFYERLGDTLLAGVAELLGRLDVLAGRRLLYAGDVRRQASGAWLVERYELLGESARRVESLQLPPAEAARLPHPERLYLEVPGSAVLRPLHPLVVYDAEAGQVLFLNSRRGRQRAEYLCYTTGQVMERTDLTGDQRELLARVLDLPVESAQVEQWAVRSQAEDAPAGDGPQGPRRYFGEFELLSELGRGGMGVVYRAWQPSLGRQVALKCLLRAGDAKAEARFAREVRALGRVEHPGLVKIFTSGVEGEQWYYAMELVEGPPLAAVCEQLQTRQLGGATLDPHTWQDAVSQVWEAARAAEKPLSGAEGPPPGHAATKSPATTATLRAVAGGSAVRLLAGLVRQVAEAAHALHEAGIVHRDIKPGNILVSPDGGHAVLMDLGLAQLADEADGRLTRTRQFVGTLRYASPEQVLAVGKVDRRSDVYSLGATLWELLTLRPLFGATEQMPTSELMRRITQDEPDRPRQHNPAVPADLEAVVLKCLEKDPAKRYATAHDLAADLRRFLDGEPVRARPVRGWERAARWVLRRPAVAALIAVGTVAAVALVVLGVVLDYEGKLRIAMARAEQERENARATSDQLEQALHLVDNERDRVKRAHALAEERRQEAEAQREAVKQKNAELEQLRYLAEVNLAHQAWTREQGGRVRDLFDRFDPRPPFAAFEWDYLRRLLRPDTCLGEGHKGAVRGVAFSPDRKHLALAARDRPVQLWEAGAGGAYRQKRALDGSGTLAHCVAFSRDAGGRGLAAGYADGTIRTWDVAGGRETLALKGHAGAVACLVYNPDGKHLVSGGRDGTVRTWDLEKGEEDVPRRLERGLPITGVDIDRGGELLAVAFGEKVQLLRAGTHEEVYLLKGHTRDVAAVAFSPDGKLLASGSDDRSICVWDVVKGERKAGLLGGHAFFVTSVAFSPDGKHLVSGGQDQRVVVWDLEGVMPEVTLRGHTDWVLGVAFSPDGDRVASVGGDPDNPDKPGEARVWEWRREQQAQLLREHTSRVLALAFSPDGRVLASASGVRDPKLGPWEDKTRPYYTGGEVRFWDVSGDRAPPGAPPAGAAGPESQVPLQELSAHANAVTSLAFTRDGRRLATASYDYTVKLWDVPDTREALRQEKPREIAAWEAHKAWVRGLAFSPDDTRLATVAGGGKRGEQDFGLKVWDVDTGRPVFEQPQDDRLKCVTFSPDGKQLATGSEGRWLKLWDAETGNPLHAFPQQAGTMAAVAFSPDGTRLAAGCGDRTVRLWDVATHKEVGCFRGHALAVESIAFTPDGRRLASGSLDGTVKVWDVETGQEALSLSMEKGQAVSAVKFSPDGSRLAAGSGEPGYPDAKGEVKVWDARPIPEKPAPK